jgi:hypothetical protein
MPDEDQSSGGENLSSQNLEEQLFIQNKLRGEERDIKHSKELRNYVFKSSNTMHINITRGITEPSIQIPNL